VLRRGAAVALAAEHGLQSGQDQKDATNDSGDSMAHHTEGGKEAENAGQRDKDTEHFVTGTGAFFRQLHFSHFRRFHN
jgi:hypothetical protein